MEQPEVRIRVGDLRRILRSSDKMLKMVQDYYASDVVKVKLKRPRLIQLWVESTGEIKERRI